ncbi:MAG: ribosome assembly RNA-binding protein YhbY [Gammaproteobacteria bacterium]|nr:ribosome assembly RNA-binding protein YhbY [Gammaproteobacteria bacterium]
MNLTENQRKHLRGLGHALKPVVMIGNAGLTDSVAAEIDAALEHHELIKVRVRVGDRKERDQVMDGVVVRLRAALIQRIGNMALLYRPAEEPKLVLPETGTQQ